MSSAGTMSGLSPAVWVAIGGLVLLQLSLQVAALVQLSKTPTERVTLGGRKIIWALIIVLGEILGPIAWFAAGRTPATVEQAAAEASEADRESAVDALYGPGPK